jgi:hypothetical protein
MNKKDLLEYCRAMGFPDPESIVRSELEEGIPQAARHTFLKGAWDMIVSDDDLSWIDAMEKASPPGSNEPYAGVSHAIRKLKKEGADLRAVAEIVRGMQAEFLFRLTYMMSDSGSVAGSGGKVSWGLFEIDEDEDPDREIGMLHESVLGTDPTGREMRPRDTEKG